MAVRKTRLAPPGLNFGIVWIFRALARCPLPMSAWARSTLVCKRRNNGWMKQLEDDVKPLFLAMILDAPTSPGSGDTNPTRNVGHKNARGMAGDRLRIQELAIDDWSRASGSLRCPDDSGGATCRFNQGLMSVCPLDPIANAHPALDDF
jgi:hypothetical protein